MQAIINLFAIFTIFGALLKGVAWALHNYQGVSRKGLIEVKNREELACDIDKVVERGLLRPFGWLETFGKIVMTNIAVEPRRSILYATYIAAVLVTFTVIGYITSGMFSVLFVTHVIFTNKRERTMRHVFHGEVS